jgi:UDP:flavonoid glycosyltransferase YjiC (YdhE family)
VVQRPPDWGDQVHITGWWHPEAEEWEPPDELLRFLDQKDKPIFIGFGSIPVENPQQTTKLIVRAVMKAGTRAIVHKGWAGLGNDLPDGFIAIDFAPYMWLFDRVAAVVHHGGSGTSGLAFRSGVPNVVVPFGFDQFYWGDRAFQLGIAPELLPFRELNSEDLAERIATSITDHSMAAQAALLGQKLQEEDGVSNAVEIIGKMA